MAFASAGATLSHPKPRAVPAEGPAPHAPTLQQGHPRCSKAPSCAICSAPGSVHTPDRAQAAEGKRPLRLQGPHSKASLRNGSSVHLRNTGHGRCSPPVLGVGGPVLHTQQGIAGSVQGQAADAVAPLLLGTVGKEAGGLFSHMPGGFSPIWERGDFRGQVSQGKQDPREESLGKEGGLRAHPCPQGSPSQEPPGQRVPWLWRK